MEQSVSKDVHQGDHFDLVFVPRRANGAQTSVDGEVVWDFSSADTPRVEFDLAEDSFTVTVRVLDDAEPGQQNVVVTAKADADVDADQSRQVVAVLNLAINVKEGEAVDAEITVGETVEATPATAPEAPAPPATA